MLSLNMMNRNQELSDIVYAAIGRIQRQRAIEDASKTKALIERIMQFVPGGGWRE